MTVIQPEDSKLPKTLAELADERPASTITDSDIFHIMQAGKSKGALASQISAYIVTEFSATISGLEASIDAIEADIIDLIAADALALPKAGGTMTGALTISIAGSNVLSVDGESTTQYRLTRYSANASDAQFVGRKARGTISAPAAVVTNDRLGGFASAGYTGSGFVTAMEFRITTIAATPSATDMECRAVLFLVPAGSVALSEMLRADHATGFSMYGANPVIDQNRHHRLRSYTVATLPSASPAGMLIYVSDGTANKRLAVSDGTNWRFPDGNVVS